MTTTEDTAPAAAPPDGMPAVLTVMEAAKVLRVGRGTMYRLIAAGGVRSVRVGRVIRVPRSALLELVETRVDGTTS